MKRLIWKEWREKRMWMLVFFAFVAVTLVVTQDGLSFGGRIETCSPWVFVLLLPALLMGLNTFSRETRYECQDFLFARPIGWKQILGAKVLVDCVAMLTPILACAVLCRLLLPPDYAPFAGFWQLAAGVEMAFAVVLMGYLPGFGASVVLPGLLGGALVLCMVGVAVGSEAVYVMQIGKNAWIGLIASWVIAVIVASVLMARRGLGLSAKERARKYAIYVAVISTVMLAWAVPVANHLNLGSSTDVVTDISPDGRFILEFRYGVATIAGNNAPTGEAFLIRRSDGMTRQVELSTVPLPVLNEEYHWCAPNLLVLVPSYPAWEHGNRLIGLSMGDSGRIVRRETPDLHIYCPNTLFSPDQHYAALFGSAERGPGKRICMVDVNNMKPIFEDDFPDVDPLSGGWESATGFRLGVERKAQGQKLHAEPLLSINPDGTVTMETPNWQVEPRWAVKRVSRSAQ